MNKCEKCDNPVFSWEVSCPQCGGALTPEEKEHHVPLGGGIFTPSYPTKSAWGDWAQGYWNITATPWQRVEKTFYQIFREDYRLYYYLSFLSIIFGSLVMVSSLIFIWSPFDSIGFFVFTAGCFLFMGAESYVEIKHSNEFLNRYGDIRNSFPADTRAGIFSDLDNISETSLKPEGVSVLDKGKTFRLLAVTFLLMYSMILLYLLFGEYFDMFFRKTDYIRHGAFLALFFIASQIFLIPLRSLKRRSGVSDYKYILTRNYLFRLFRPHRKNILAEGEKIIDAIPVGISGDRPRLIVITDRAIIDVDPIACLKGKPGRNDFWYRNLDRIEGFYVGKKPGGSGTKTSGLFTIIPVNEKPLLFSTGNCITHRRAVERIRVILT